MHTIYIYTVYSKDKGSSFNSVIVQNSGGAIRQVCQPLLPFLWVGLFTIGG